MLYGEETSFIEAGDESVHTMSFWNCETAKENEKMLCSLREREREREVQYTSEEFSGGDVGEERVGAWSFHWH